MKLVIIQGCVIGGGKTAEPGNIIDTGDIANNSDKVAYDLIANGRALSMRRFNKNGDDVGPNAEAEAFVRDFKAQQAEAAQAAIPAPAEAAVSEEAEEAPVVNKKKK